LPCMIETRPDPLPGDEREPVVSAGLGRDLRTMPVSDLQPSTPILLAGNATVSMAIDRMRAERVSCVLVVADDDSSKLVGSFCERDLLMNVAGARHPSSTRLCDVMCEGPPTVKTTDPAAFVLNRMIVEEAPQVVVVDAAGAPVGVITMRHVLSLLAELYPQGLLNLPPEEIIPETSAGA
jgi:CBS domain-containing protein